MKKNLGPWAALLIAASIGIAGAQDPAQKIDLKVLYAGVLDAPRTKDFKEFLSKTFSEVGTIELKSLDAKAAGRFDVVIVDSPSPYGEPSPDHPEKPNFKMPEVPKLGLDFTTPVILMGAAGGQVLDSLHIKLHWL